MGKGCYSLILCDILLPRSDRQTDWMKGGGILIKGDRIVQAFPKLSSLTINKLNQKLSQKGQDFNLIDRRGFFAIPGLVDLHFHWVQDDVCLMPKNSLLTWLKDYTWPQEAKFKSLTYASLKSQEFEKKLLRAGTLGGAVFGSIHGHTVDLALKNFKGHFIAGNVLMTMNSPDYLSQSNSEAIKLTTRLAKKYGPKYAVTPRFAPTTDPMVMQEVARVAKRENTFIQSHLCETKEEIEYVMDLYRSIPGFHKIKSYSEIYAKAKILGPRTIMGHGIYLSKDDWKWILQSNTIIAHCPTSNAPLREMGLGSGLFDLALADRKKLKWALASDIGGGPFLSMFDVIHSFVRQQRKSGRASYRRGLFRATAAGANLLKLDEKLGVFDRGTEANFVLLPMPKIISGDGVEDLLARVISRKVSERESFNDFVGETWWQGQPRFSIID